MRKAYLIILLVSCVLLCGIIAVARDARQLQAKLDELYWVRDNTHSGMVGIFIDIAESKLQQKTTTLMTLIASFVIFVVAGVYATSKRLSRVPTIGGTLLLFLLLLPVPAHARLMSSADHYYARVQMYVPGTDPFACMHNLVLVGLVFVTLLGWLLFLFRLLPWW